ncbi:MAG TPA: ferritin family protein, partial [Spirochaetales bacterium]|nr:ferritin family protein [Spirochaetales bacterium]
KKSAHADLKAIFAELAQEELTHKAQLEGYLNGVGSTLQFKAGADYKVSESVQLPTLSPTMSFAEGVALAMKKEQDAMEMYRQFAEASANPQQKETFMQLANMEQGHKAKLEALYTNAAFAEAW